VGPIARDPDDLFLALQIIAGPDGEDPLVVPLPVSELPAVSVRDLRVAWMPTFGDLPVQPEIAAALEAAAAELGRRVRRVERCQPAVDLEHQWQLRESLRDLVLGSYAPSSPGSGPIANPIAPFRERDRHIGAWERFFLTWDVVLCPVTLSTAPLHYSAATRQLVAGQEVEYHRMFAFSTIVNYTGHPAVSVPVGRDQNGLPIGIQIIGPRWQDERLLAITKLLAEELGWRCASVEELDAVGKTGAWEPRAPDS
jgi:amidase